MNLIQLLSESVNIPQSEMIQYLLNMEKANYKMYIAKVGDFVDVNHLVLDNFNFLIAYQNDNLIGFISLNQLPNKNNLYIIKYGKSYLDDSFVLLNMLIVAKENLGYQIINDVNITDFGQMSWKSMCKIGVVSKLYNFEEDKIYNYNHANISLPELNSNWFYMIDNRNKFNIGFAYPRESSVTNIPYYREFK